MAAGLARLLQGSARQQVGDILTVNIEIDDSASLNNSTTRSRKQGRRRSPPFSATRSCCRTSFRTRSNPDNLVNLDSDSNSSGTGAVQRQEDIKFELAAIVTQVLPGIETWSSAAARRSG